MLLLLLFGPPVLKAILELLLVPVTARLAALVEELKSGRL